MESKQVTKRQKQDIRRLLSLVQNHALPDEKCHEELTSYLAVNPNICLDNFRYEASGDTILHCAARQGNLHLIAFLLEHFDPNCRNNDNKTPLHETAQFAQVEAAAVLLKSGADVNALKKADWTPLMLSCTKLQTSNNEQHLLEQARRHDLVNLLLEHSAVVNFQNKDGWTALHLATREGDLELVKTLCLHGADARMRTKNGNTCLHIGALHGHTETFEYLLGSFDGLHVQSNQGNYALHEAVLSKDLEHFKRIALLYQEDIQKFNRQLERLINKSGYNVLHLAAFIGHVDIVNYCLRELSFDVRLTTCDGQNCLHLATNPEVYDRLLTLGAEEGRRDKFGRTPRDFHQPVNS